MQPILIPLLLISSAPALAGAESAPLPAGEIANPDVVLEEKAIKGDAQAQAELASLFDGKSSDCTRAVKLGREMSPARPRPGAIDIRRHFSTGSGKIWTVCPTRKQQSFGAARNLPSPDSDRRFAEDRYTRTFLSLQRIAGPASFAGPFSLPCSPQKDAKAHSARLGK